MRFSTRHRSLLKPRLCDGSVDKPLLDELVQGSVSTDLSQAGVQRIEQFAALLDREAELFTGFDTFDGDRELTGVAGDERIGGHAVDHHAVDVAVEQRLDGCVEVVVQLDAVTADEVLSGDGVGRAGLGAEDERAVHEVIQGVALVLDAGGDGLVDHEVRVGEVDDLSTVGGDGAAWGEQVELAGCERQEYASPGSGDEVSDAADAFKYGGHDVDVETDDGAIRVNRLERRVGGVRSDPDGDATQVLGERQRQQGCCGNGDDSLHGPLPLANVILLRLKANLWGSERQDRAWLPHMRQSDRVTGRSESGRRDNAQGT